jgi:hypothetical protein
MSLALDGDDNDRDTRQVGVRRHLLQDALAVHLWHDEIQQHQIGLLRLH